ncbi:putative conserved plasma membrane protein [Trichostrongylus colubriformis]|uniref:Conserved plasma membrane protein n=1 Tax=Trichostrongylus colubriformis TaxID=6319 RepID=A0AAN8FFQ1_TRICO
MVSLFYRIFVGPYRYLRPSYVQRPRASSILRSYLKYRAYPSWTSYFVEYRQVQDDHFAEKHFNFDVDGHNYHVLRVGCFPYIKYHCTKRPVQDLSAENRLYRLITVVNLGE